MDNSKTGAPQKDGASTNPPSIEDLLSQGNWEERVAAARKKRDALKAESPKKADSRAPTFPEFAPNAPQDDSFVFNDAPSTEPKAPAPEPIDLMAKLAARNPSVTPRPAAEAPPPAQPVENRPRPTVVAPAVTAAPAPQPKAEKKEKSKVAIVAFACCFGIGIGLALGAGLVWSLGGFGGLQSIPSQQTAAVEPSPTPLQFTFPLTTNQIAPSSLSGLVVPRVSETALTKPLAAQPPQLQLAALSRTAPPALAAPGPRFAPAVAETAAAQAVRPFTLGPVPAISAPVATPNLLSGLQSSNTPQAPAIPTSRPIPVQVQSIMSGLNVPAFNVPETRPVASKHTPDVSPVILAMQRPTGNTGAVFATPPSFEPVVPVQVQSSISGLNVPELTLPEIAPAVSRNATPDVSPVVFAMQRPAGSAGAVFATPPSFEAVIPVQVQSSISGLNVPGFNLSESGSIVSKNAVPDVSPVVVAMQRPLGDAEPAFAAPLPFAPVTPVEPLLEIAPNFVGPEAGTLNPELPSWSAAPRTAPVDAALQRPLPKKDTTPQSLVAPSTTFPSVSFDVSVIPEPEAPSLASKLPAPAPLARIPNAQALETPASVSRDVPVTPLTAPSPPTAPFDERLEQLDELSAAPALAPEFSPFESSTVPITNPTLVARYEAVSPEVVTVPWRAPNFLAQLGMSTEQTAGLELVLNAPDSVAEEDMVAQAGSLGETGLVLQKQNRVPFKITKPHIRYYNNADARLAQALAVKFDVEARDFSSNGADNGANRIEFWMAGQTDRKPAATKRVAKKKSTPRRKTVRRVDPTQALRQKLARKLRQGDHL